MGLKCCAFGIMRSFSKHHLRSIQPIASMNNRSSLPGRPLGFGSNFSKREHISSSMTIRDIPSPQPSSREKHHHTIKAPSAGEGADRGEIKNLCSIQDKIVFKKTSGTLPNIVVNRYL
jgi:hypothetical protein